MDKIGIKFLDILTYEDFESFQYLLYYDFEYDDMVKHIEEKKVIELDIEEDEDRDEDLEALAALLAEFDRKELKYDLYSFSDKWVAKELIQLC